MPHFPPSVGSSWQPGPSAQNQLQLSPSEMPARAKCCPFEEESASPLPLSFFFKSIYLFIYLERGSGGGAERQGEKTPSRLYNASTEPSVGLELMNCEVMTWAEIKRCSTKWATQVPQPSASFTCHPGLPLWRSQHCVPFSEVQEPATGPPLLSGTSSSCLDLSPTQSMGASSAESILWEFMH